MSTDVTACYNLQLKNLPHLCSGHLELTCVTPLELRTSVERGLKPLNRPIYLPVCARRFVGGISVNCLRYINKWHQQMNLLIR